MALGFRTLIVGLMTISLLFGPLDCFGTTGVNREALDCCAKGKCVPTGEADNCCKRIVPDGRDFVMASSKVLVHVLAPLHVIAIEQRFSTFSSATVSPCFELDYSPPGSPPGSRLALPLLI